MNIDNLTIGEARKLAAMFANDTRPSTDLVTGHDTIPVLVCTDKRGVVFGYTDNADARPLVLTKARMALYWESKVGGVFGLADLGPTKGCKISASVPSVTLEGITAVFAVEPAAEKAWLAAPVQGR